MDGQKTTELSTTNVQELFAAKNSPKERTANATSFASTVNWRFLPLMSATPDCERKLVAFSVEEVRLATAPRSYSLVLS